MKRIKLLLPAIIIFVTSLLNAESKAIHYGSKSLNFSNGQYTFKITNQKSGNTAEISLQDPCTITPQIIKVFENNLTKANESNSEDTTEENKLDLLMVMKFALHECKNPSLR